MDLKLAHFEDILPINSTGLVSTDPYTVFIKGADFSSAKRVFINNTSVPFITKSNKLIWASPADNASINEVAVISSKFTSMDRSLIDLTISARPEYISGLLRLMQRFMRLLLRDPGSDKFNRELGGGLNALLTRYVDAASNVVLQDVALAVVTTERQLMQLQATQKLDASEKLASATLLQVAPGANTLSASIELISQSGITGKMTLGL